MTTTFSKFNGPAATESADELIRQLTEMGVQVSWDITVYGIEPKRPGWSQVTRQIHVKTSQADALTALRNEMRLILRPIHPSLASMGYDELTAPKNIRDMSFQLYKFDELAGETARGAQS